MSNAKQVGDSFEAVIRKSAKAQNRLGLVLDQTTVGVNVRRIGPGGEVRGRVRGKADVDFVGDYMALKVRFDAKSTASATSFPLKDIRRNQVKRIRDLHGRGGAAFFLLELRATGTYWAMPWPFLKSYWNEFDMYGEPASIPFDAIRAGCIPVTRTGALLDLVTVIKTLQERREAA